LQTVARSAFAREASMNIPVALKSRVKQQLHLPWGVAPADPELVHVCHLLPSLDLSGDEAQVVEVCNGLPPAAACAWGAAAT